MDRLRSRPLFALCFVVLALTTFAGAAWLGVSAETLSSSACDSAGTPWQWFKADTHVHTVVSGDGFTDLGIIGQKAKAAGYNALFLTDHDLASDLPVTSGSTVNHLVFEDSYSGWTSGNHGTLASGTNTLVSGPVYSGTKSLHLSASSTSYGESFIRAAVVQTSVLEASPSRFQSTRLE